jgi:glycosyltransferase involved in cell wall biosynthesis
MASGLPCIVSDACGCAEDMVGPLDPELVFRVADTADLARAVAHLVEHPLPKNRIAEQIGRFSFKGSVDTMVALADQTKTAVERLAARTPR